MGFSSLFLAKPAVGVRRERDERNFSFSLRSTEIRWSESVEPRFKFIYLTRATHGYRQHVVSPKILGLEKKI